MGRLLLLVIVAGCQPLISVDAEPSVEWIAIVTVDGDDRLVSATGLMPVDAPLYQSSEGITQIFGFTGEQIDESANLSEPVRFAEPCDAALSPIWAAEQNEREYTEISPRQLTSSWLGPKCAQSICFAGECRDAVVDIDAGEHSACAHWASGKVSCWGHNGYGSVGRSEHDLSLVTEAAFVPGIEDAVELSVGDAQVCVRRSDGRVTCWGPDFQGEQMGGEATTRGLPRAIQGVEGALSISAGESHACFVSADRRVGCWGRNELGELGDGTLQGSGLPVEVLGISNAAQVGTGSSHSCGRTEEGRVLCWGSDEAGQLGQGIERGAKFLDVGGNHSCAITDAGEVSCWGANGLGQLGGGAPQLTGPAASVDLGLETSCALLEDGSVECWGGTKHGELPELDAAPFFLSIPVRAPVTTASIDVAVGHFFACTLDVERNVWCWGSNAYAALGNGKSGSVHQRQAVLDAQIEELAAGDEMTCARYADGNVQCWGHNNYGQLGRGTLTLLEGPGDAMLPGPATAIAAGAAHACAIVEGDVYCWGDNLDYQVVTSNETSIEQPLMVMSGARELAVGDFHSCAILLDGTVSCWGSNSEGQVGHGDWGTTQPPAPVPNIVFAETGDAGLDQTCVLLQNRTLRCWGRYAEIAALQQVDQIQVGRRFSCAISGGQVYCWGANDHGQLGDGTLIDRAGAGPVLEVFGARSLALGSSHGCVVAGAGELWCWGDNQAAQLSDGNWPHDRPTPARVEGLGPVRFGEGFRHACVHLESGRVECWGWNEWGQVGFESAAIHLVPTRVVGLEPR